MGWWDRLLGRDIPFDTFDAAQRVLPDPYEPFRGVADPGMPLRSLIGVDEEAFWRAQPNVRKVIGFIARNVASIPLHVYERRGDTDRRRVTDHPLARLVANPRRGVGSFRFWNDVLSDGLLYDRWGALKAVRSDGSVELMAVPSKFMRLDVDPWRRVDSVRVWAADPQSGRHQWVRFPLDQMVFDHGYAPTTAGLSPIETLRDVLDESAEAVRYRRQVWANDARVQAWIERPPGAEWSKEAKERFAKQFRDSYTGDGENAGGVPLLEDGMRLNELSTFHSQDAQDLEGRRLTAAEVAAAFYVAPELVGAQQGTFSNIDAFRQMLYRDSLGPYIVAWEQALNTMLTPDLAEGRDLYIEAHIDAKLRGSFIEQAQVMQSATGAPWMTRNEARAMQNRPPVDGGDELVTPLNVLVGGQASPRDSGSQNRRSGRSLVKARGPVMSRESESEPLHIKAATREQDEQAAELVLRRFFARQRRVVLSELGAKDAAWWDEERWNTELADDLFALAMSVSAEIGQETAEALGFDPDSYDVARTERFLREVAASRAGAINSTTRDQVQAALDGDVGEDAERGTPAGVFDQAEDSRAAVAGVTLATTLATFAVTEFGRQLNRPSTTKTWVVTSGNPRPSHAAMSGETVDIEGKFSNGADWPGDPAAGVDEVAGCSCVVDITVP